MERSTRESMKLQDLDETKNRAGSNSSAIVISQIEQPTNWNLIYFAGLVGALTSVENTIITIGEWPYMRTLDFSATAQFYGYTKSTNKIAHGIFAIIFSIWSYKLKSVRAPLAVGRVLAIFAYVMYICIEYIPIEKRYIMGGVFVLVAISDSSNALLQAYIAKHSTSVDRSKAFAIIGLSSNASIVLGPLCQLIFSAISYPGIELFEGLSFHIYSAPIWLAMSLAVISIFVIVFHLDDPKRERIIQEKEDATEQKIKFSIKKLRNSELEWGLVAACLAVKVANAFSDSSIQTTSSIFFMVQYGWSGEQTVRAESAIQIGFGVLSSLILVLYIFCKLGETIAQHKLVLTATIASCMVFFLTYPYKFTSSPVVLYNATTHSGCNSDEYSWCDTAYAVNPLLYLVIFIVLSGPVMPLMHAALGTVYSNILGEMDQSIAQGVMTVLKDFVYTITPIFSIFIFTHSGIALLWILNFGAYLIVTVIWFSRLGKLEKVCDYYECDT